MSGDGLDRFICDIAFPGSKHRQMWTIRGNGLDRFVRAAGRDVDRREFRTIRGDALDRIVRDLVEGR